MKLATLHEFTTYRVIGCECGRLDVDFLYEEDAEFHLESHNGRYIEALHTFLFAIAERSGMVTDEFQMDAQVRTVVETIQAQAIIETTHSAIPNQPELVVPDGLRYVLEQAVPHHWEDERE